MFTNALYYPYILIPDNLWLRRAILYWDKICPIVPSNMARQIPQKHISKELMNYGVLDFINPESVLDYSDSALEESFSSFLKTVADNDFLSKIGPPEKREYSYKIHRDKFAHGWLKNLHNLNLFQETTDDKWLQFEINTGTIYMGFLASNLARRLHLEPITDNKVYHNGYLQSQLIPSTSSVASISLVLEKVLPAPSEPIALKKLLKFKERHERELLAFRNTMRNTVQSLESVPESQHESRLHSLKDEVEERCLTLHRKLKEERIETVLSCVEAPFKISMLEVLAIRGGITVSVPIAASIFGAGAAIRIAKEIFTSRMRRQSILKECPYAYVYNVKKKFG